MKTRSQKLISLVLVLMMLVTMIPAGFFGASAVSAELDAALADYDNATEFVINNVEDWEAVSALGKGFDGRTVKLGADIDAEGGSLPMLFPNGFGGTFDGQGYTVKNATVTTTGDAALIATTLTGTVMNLNLENCSVTGTAKVGMIAASATNATITNVNATGKVTNTTNTGYTGGIVGYITVSTGGSFSNIWSKIVVKGEMITDGGWLGGFCGQVNITETADWTMTNCYISGAIDNGAKSSTNATGLWGKTNGVQGQDIALLTNVIVDMDMSLAYGNSLVIGYHANGNIVTSNLYSTTKANNGTWTQATVRWSFLTQNAASFIDEKTNPWAAGDPAGDASVKIVSKEIVAYMPVIDETTGFMTGITAPEDVVLPEPDPTPDPEPDPDPTPSEPTTLDEALAAYDTVTEFVINSVEDWNKIAAYSAANTSRTWAGKTIKLGADLVGEVDANGAPTTVLNQLSPVQFYGTFDGCGYTIKNVKAGANTFFTAKIDGTTFKNVTFDNVLVAASSYSGIFTGIVNDWASSTFSNITVKNSTVTSASGDSGMFCGIVDNKAGTLTFSNITIIDSELVGATHTGLLFGSLQTQNAGTNLVIDGIKVDNASVSNTGDANIGGLIGWVRPNGAEDTAMTIKNVNITGIKVSSGENYATGGLIGRINHTLYNIALENINIAGSVTTTSTATTDYIGGVIGKIEAGGTVSVQKLYSNMTVTATNAAVMMGGFCAYVGVASGKQFILKDSYIGGAVVANTAHSTSTAGVICKVAGKAGENIANISNIVVNVDMSQAAGNAMTILGVHDGNVLLSKCYSVTASNGGVAAGGKVRWSFMSHNGTSFINGVANPWTSSDVAGDKFVTIITAKAASMMAKKNADGFVAGVYTTTASAYQASAVSNEKFAVRFIAFDFMGDATNISMNVIARVQGGVSKSFTADCTMYDALTAYHAQGITSTYRADAFDAKAIAGFTIYNIPTGAAIDFTVTVTYTTADGTFSNVMNLSFDANGLCTTSPMAN